MGFGKGLLVMKLEFDISAEFEERLKEIVMKATLQVKAEEHRQMASKEWMTIKEATAYVGVSYNTFMKFRTLGLVICEIEGVKRVSKKEVDSFLQNNSF